MEARDIINECIQETIDEYYLEYTPNQYERSERFLNSLVKTKVVKIGNVLKCEIKIDEDYLNYQYYADGKPTVTGLDVVTMANSHSHGGIYDDDFSCFWEDAIEALGGQYGIISILKKKLAKRGLNK